MEGRAAGWEEEGAAQRVAIERLMRAKAAREQRIAVLLTERNRLAQLLASTRVEEKEEEGEADEWRVGGGGGVG